MSNNEDWYDEDDDSNEPETGQCPECRGPVCEFTGKCPACGYWLSAADHRQMWSSEAKPKWVLITGAVILVILLLSALTLHF